MTRPDKKLQAKWYAKLKKSGFEDIEQDEEYLKRYSNDFGRNHNPGTDEGVTRPNKDDRKKDVEMTRIRFQARQDYYYYAQHFLNDHKFESSRERLIWEHHAKGTSIRNIIKILNKLSSKKAKRDTTWRVIKRLAELMKAKYIK